MHKDKGNGIVMMPKFASLGGDILFYRFLSVAWNVFSSIWNGHGMGPEPGRSTLGEIFPGLCVDNLFSRFPIDWSSLSISTDLLAQLWLFYCFSLWQFMHRMGRELALLTSWLISVLVPLWFLQRTFFANFFSFHFFVIFLYGLFTSDWSLVENKFSAVNFPSNHFSNSLELQLATNTRKKLRTFGKLNVKFNQLKVGAWKVAILAFSFFFFLHFTVLS